MCSRGDELYEDCETLDKLGVVMDTRAVWEVPQGSDGGPHVWDLTPQCMSKQTSLAPGEFFKKLT